MCMKCGKRTSGNEGARCTCRADRTAACIEANKHNLVDKKLYNGRKYTECTNCYTTYLL